MTVEPRPRAPLNQQLLDGDGQLHQAWAAYFQGLGGVDARMEALVTQAAASTATLAGMGTFVTSAVAISSAVGLTSNVAADIATISLVAGDWDVWGTVGFRPNAGTTPAALLGWINTVAATPPADAGAGAVAVLALPFTIGVDQIMPVGSARLLLAATTTVRLGALAVFGGSTMGGFGFIGARRRK